MFSYPSDEVGNPLVSLDALDEKGIDPWTDVLDLARYRELFGENKHPFTGVDYVDLLLRSDPCRAALRSRLSLPTTPVRSSSYTKYVLNCDIHSRARTKRRLRAAGAELVCGLDDIHDRSGKRKRLQ